MTHNAGINKEKAKSQNGKKFGKQQQLRTSHVVGTSKGSRRGMIQNILMNCWSRTSWWIIRCERKLLGYDWVQPRRDQATLFFLLSSWLSWDRFRCVAQNLRIPGIVEFSEFKTATACVWPILSCFHVWCNCTLSSTLCKHTPCQQCKSHQL